MTKDVFYLSIFFFRKKILSNNDIGPQHIKSNKKEVMNCHLLLLRPLAYRQMFSILGPFKKKKKSPNGDRPRKKKLFHIFFLNSPRL